MTTLNNVYHSPQEAKMAVDSTTHNAFWLASYHSLT